MKCKAAVLLPLFIILLSSSAFAGFAPAPEEVPLWLRQASASGLPAYPSEVPAVVLVRRQNVEVAADGRSRTETRRALKILNRDGQSYAIASVWYRADGEKVRDISAWVITPSGTVRKYGKKETLDIAAGEGTYSDVRLRAISAVSDVEQGSIFGYEVELEESPLFDQIEWQFQDRLPVLRSTMSLEVSEGWRVESRTFNHAAIEPVVSGRRYTWELQDLPFVKYEPASPSLSQVAARVGISYSPPPGASVQIGKSFQNWAEVARWLAELQDPPVVVNEALRVKTKDLTSAAKGTPDAVAAISRWVQGIRYVSIQTGLGRGGGYRPRAAPEVFDKLYGDCKDKATLMRAMLKALGIPSFALSVYSEGSDYVREEWPSPQQFNHAIVAVQVPDDVKSSMIIVHPRLGRLLPFDPTDPDTSPGDLPESLQGSLALVVAASEGDLIRMPTSLPEANRVERRIEAALVDTGGIKGRIQEIAFGQSAASFRREYRSRSEPEYRKVIERWVAGGMPNAYVSGFAAKDQTNAGTFETDIRFAADGYGQLMQNRLLVFKPVLVSRRDDLALVEVSRTHPVVLNPHAFSEEARLTLPEGFEVDEVPERAKLDTSFGSYSTGYEVRQKELVFTRSLVLKGGTVPVDRYADVRGFFERIRAAEQAPVVLVRK